MVMGHRTALEHVIYSHSLARLPCMLMHSLQLTCTAHESAWAFTGATRPHYPATINPNVEKGWVKKVQFGDYMCMHGARSLIINGKCMHFSQPTKMSNENDKSRRVS